MKNDKNNPRQYRKMRRLKEKDNISEEAKKIFESGKCKYAFSTNPQNYTYTQELIKVNQGYDILENILMVRKYIQRKFDMKFVELEILLYLYPKSYFTNKDYLKIPRYHSMAKLYYFESKGLFMLFSKAKENTPAIYCLTEKAEKIVKLFYKLLSGEEKMPTYKYKNPLLRNNEEKKDSYVWDSFIKEAEKSIQSDQKKALYLLQHNA